MQKELKKNFIFAFLAQGISLIVSCSTNLVLPKVLSVVNYSYWQLFIFYSTYIPCLALGLNDGVYLRYGGILRSKLDGNTVKSQFGVGIIFQTILGMIVGTVMILFSDSANRQKVIFLVVVYYLFYTCHNFLGYIFQAINETNIYSKSIIIIRIVFLLSQIILMWLGYTEAYPYIVLYIVSIALALGYLLIRIHPEFSISHFDINLGIRESLISMRVGISLMIANICSLLILGVGRQIVDMKWGLVAFGKVSFSLTLMNFALTFIMQIGLVLFPALRRLSSDELKGYYGKLTLGLFYILPLMYIVYLPVQYILELWLPDYKESISYLATVLPICYFDSKMNLIGNTFFKVLNKQVLLLKINIITIVISSIFGLISAYIFNSMYFVIVGMVLAIIFRSVLADTLLSKDIKTNVSALEVADVILAIIFMFVSNSFDWRVALIIVCALYILRIFLVKTKILKIKEFN